MNSQFIHDMNLPNTSISFMLVTPTKIMKLHSTIWPICQKLARVFKGTGNMFHSSRKAISTKNFQKSLQDVYFLSYKNLFLYKLSCGILVNDSASIIGYDNSQYCFWLVESLSVNQSCERGVFQNSQMITHIKMIMKSFGHIYFRIEQNITYLLFVQKSSQFLRYFKF